jgi:hypothetical protein
MSSLINVLAAARYYAVETVGDPAFDSGVGLLRRITEAAETEAKAVEASVAEPAPERDEETAKLCDYMRMCMHMPLGTPSRDVARHISLAGFSAAQVGWTDTMTLDEAKRAVTKVPEDAADREKRRPAAFETATQIRTNGTESWGVYVGEYGRANDAMLNAIKVFSTEQEARAAYAVEVDKTECLRTLASETHQDVPFDAADWVRRLNQLSPQQMMAVFAGAARGAAPDRVSQTRQMVRNSEIAKHPDYETACARMDEWLKGLDAAREAEHVHGEACNHGHE